MWNLHRNAPLVDCKDCAPFVPCADAQESHLLMRAALDAAGVFPGKSWVLEGVGVPPWPSAWAAMTLRGSAIGMLESRLLKENLEYQSTTGGMT